MSLRFLLVMLGLARLASAQAQACLLVEGDRVLAKDLSVALPDFSKIPPETILAIAPLPGVVRVFHSFDLAALSKRYSVDLGSVTEVCVQRTMQPLDRALVLDAMRAALPVSDARIEIVETSTWPVPRGRIEFRRENLRSPALPSAGAPVEWRGNVIYGENRKFSIWARVRVSAPQSRVVAAAALKRGEAIGASQVRLESVNGFPGMVNAAESVDQVVGLIPWRNIAVGEAVSLTHLTAPLEVSRGDAVTVEVRSGAAKLSLTAKAESDGRNGDVIAVRNPASNKVFQARVTGKGTVLVDASRARANTDASRVPANVSDAERVRGN